METQPEPARPSNEAQISAVKRIPGVSPHSAHRELEAQAISVAESILGSPQVGSAPTDINSDERLTTVPLRAAESLGVSHVFVPTSLLENLRISDTEGKQTNDDFENNDDEEDENPDQTSLFVGDLSRSVTEAMLKQAFSQHGEVIMVDVRRDKITQNNLGYGFVQMKTHDQALMGKKTLHGTVVGGRKIRIGWAQKNTTLFIGDLDGTITTEHLKEVFGKFGSLVEDETFVKAGSGKFGFVRFRYRIDAERAKAEMNGRFIGSRPCRIGWGENTVQKNCVHVQFLQGAHVYENPLGENEIRDLFDKFGPVVSVSLPRYGNRRLKGYGFVHFQDSEDGEKAATAAIKALNDKTIAGVTLRCTYGKRQGAARVRNGYNYPLPGGGGGGPIPGVAGGRGGQMNGFTHGSPQRGGGAGFYGGGPNGQGAIRRRQLSWLMNSRNWQALQALALQADLQDMAAVQALGFSMGAQMPGGGGGGGGRDRDGGGASDRDDRGGDRHANNRRGTDPRDLRDPRGDPRDGMNMRDVRDVRDRDHMPPMEPMDRDSMRGGGGGGGVGGGDRDAMYRDMASLRDMPPPRDMRSSGVDMNMMRGGGDNHSRGGGGGGGGGDLRGGMRDGVSNGNRGDPREDHRGGGVGGGGGGGVGVGSGRDRGDVSDRDAYYSYHQASSPPMDGFSGPIRPNNGNGNNGLANPSSASPPRHDQVHNLSSLFSSRSPQSDAFYASTMSTLASVSGPSSSFSSTSSGNDRSPTLNGYMNGHATSPPQSVNPAYNGRYMSHSSSSSLSSLSSLSSPFTPLPKDVKDTRPMNGTGNPRKSPSPINYQP